MAQTDANNEANHAKRMITVLTKTSGHWTQREDSRIMTTIHKPMSGIPLSPEILLLDGEYDREMIANAIGHNDFELKVVEGLDNPELPFTPQFM